MIKPIFSNGFSKKPSKNWVAWLSPDYENAYMRQYPRATKVLSIGMTIFFFLPAVLFVWSLIVLTWNDIRMFGPLAGLGIIGCILIGFGLANIIGAFMHVYLGHLVTLVAMFSGVIFLGIAYSITFLLV